MIMDNTILLWILAAIAIIIVLFFLKKESKESIADVDIDPKSKLAKLIKDFLKTDTEYKEYLDFLVQNSNMSYKILEQETFYELKMLLKMNRLTEDAISDYMTDM